MVKHLKSLHSDLGKGKALQSTAQPKVSIVIPALNEEEGIGKTIAAIPRDKLENMGYNVQIIVVDNGSQDATGRLAKEAGAEVVFEPHRGYGAAFKAGFTNADGDIIATTDADCTYPVEDIPRLIKILDDDELDFITTNRFAMMQKGAMSGRNKLGNKVLSFTARFLFQVDIKDSQSGMWVFRRSLLPLMVLKSNSMALSQELKLEACHYLGCRWREVPIQYRSRTGSVKLRVWRDGVSNLLHLMKKRVSRGSKNTVGVSLHHTEERV
jgi:dolichol-phosphate hexosyltransferase